MKTKDIHRYCCRYAAPYCVSDGRKFRLKDWDPADTDDFKPEDKARAKESLAEGVEALARMQELLYAQDRWAVLLIFQGMDASGKDGAIKHVMSGINPQGCQVFSFKAPSAQELDHDFLWRTTLCLPERGRIGIFNRSYYEEVLVVRVHPKLLERQHLPEELVSADIWKNRCEDIRNHETYLARNGVIIRKFFLHLSRKEQKQRFLDRLEDPAKHWKFSATDVEERKHWNEYMSAYEAMIKQTATPQVPWHVVPADNKWFTRLVVAAATLQALSALDLSLPKLDAGMKREISAARRALLREK